MISSTDQMQREITLVAPAKRIVSLVPSQTELLFAIGAGESVVGITKFCTEPPEEVSAVAKVGGTKKFDFEAIAALRPDLIIGNKEENYPEGIEQLAQNYPVWMSDIVTPDDSLEMIRGIGLLTGRADTAEKMAATIVNSFESLALDIAPLQQSETTSDNLVTEQHEPVHSRNPQCIGDLVNVAYLIWQKPYMVAAGGTFIDEMLKLGGMQNVFGNLERYPEVDMGTLKTSGADVILLSSEPFPFRDKHATEFQSALPDKKIILVDAMPFSWYGSQLLRTAAYLRELRMKF